MLSVTLKSPDVELLTGITPQNLKDSDEFGLDFQADLKAAFEKLTLVCFLRSKRKKKNEPEPIGPVRYTAVKVYNAAAIGIATIFSSPPKDIAIASDASSEKQLITPTMGNVVEEIGARQEHAERSDRTLAVKRNLAFVSEDGTSTATVQASIQESGSSSEVMPTAATDNDVASPLKKTKEKLKQN